MTGQPSELTPPVGRFAWHDLMSVRPGEAQSFYTSLFEWDSRETELREAGDDEPLVSTLLLRDGESFCGILPLEPDQGIPSHWLGDVAVDSVADALGRAEATGGTVALPARDLEDTGRFAVVIDPAGAAVALFERSGAPESDDTRNPSPPRVFTWNQLLTADPVAVAPFYRDVFGWSLRQQQASGVGTYWIFYRGEEEIAGALQTPEQAGASAVWLPYVGVDDVDAAAARAGELGAGIPVPPSDIPDVGRYAVLADPTEATFAVFRPVSTHA